jgi:16S rRNA processing protein RimM
MSNSKAEPEKNSSREPYEGSSQYDEPSFLAVGRLGKPHGIRGEVQFYVLTDFPERIKTGVTLFLGKNKQPATITEIRPHTQKLLVRFEGYDSREEVAELRSQVAFVRTADIPPLPAGEYYYHQLTGLFVLTDEGEDLGRLAEIIETGANDVYVVRDAGGKEILLPAIDDVILKIDLENKQMVVHLLPGLR